MSSLLSALIPIHSPVPHAGDLSEEMAPVQGGALCDLDRAPGTGQKSKDPGKSAVSFGSRCGKLFQGLRRPVRPVVGAGDDYDDLLGMIGDSRIVFLGGSSHGTREFQRQRVRITKQLILEKGFNAVAVDADWLDACRLDRLASGGISGPVPSSCANEAEGSPSWMWRNDEVLDFIEWLANHHSNARSDRERVGIYGLDLFSVRKSMAEVVTYLEDEYPTETSAKRLFQCIDRFGRDPQNYGLLAGTGLSDGCRAKIIRHLTDKRMMEAEYLANCHHSAEDTGFLAAGIERLRGDAELYYRKLFRSYTSSWNLRADHMMEMLGDLIARLQAAKGSAKIVVWAHNSQMGDARATELALHGEWNFGQLARETFADECKLIGITTYAGTVTASPGWCRPGESMVMPSGIEGGCESILHHLGVPDFWIDLRQHNPLVEELSRRHLERAIGVVYRPAMDRDSNYYETSLALQFDALIHFDISHAAVARTRPSEWNPPQVPQHSSRVKLPDRQVAV